MVYLASFRLLTASVAINLQLMRLKCNYLYNMLFLIAHYLYASITISLNLPDLTSTKAAEKMGLPKTGLIYAALEQELADTSKRI